MVFNPQTPSFRDLARTDHDRPQQGIRRGIYDGSQSLRVNAFHWGFTLPERWHTGNQAQDWNVFYGPTTRLL